MSLSQSVVSPLTRGATGLSDYSWRILFFGGVLLVASVLVRDPAITVVLGVSAGTVLCVLLAMRVVLWVNRNRSVLLAQRMAEHDPARCFLTDSESRVLWRNTASYASISSDTENPLETALSGIFADPSPIIFRQLAQAQQNRPQIEEIQTRQGVLRLTVHAVEQDRFFWRLEEFRGQAVTGATSPAFPVLNVDAKGNVLAVNQTARDLLGGGPKRFRKLEIGAGLMPGAQVELTGPEGPVALRLISIASVDGANAVSFMPLEYGHGDGEGAFFESLPVALMRLDLDGNIRMANRLSRDLLGISASKPQLVDVVEGLGRSVLDWLNDVAENRASSRVEVLRVRREDRELFVQIALKRIVQDGAPGILAVLHDATDLKTLEAQFVQSQKMQAIGQLAGGVAHDFNNLLTAISGHCDLLLLRHDESDPDFSDLMQINQNANRAASLVGQLLAFSRKQTLKLEPVDLHDTLTDLTHLLNRLVGERVRLSVSHDPNLAQIRADKRQLEQVIMNLVVNARDAMPNGGEIRIETSPLNLTEELRRDRAVVAPGDYVLVRVSDQGIGIPKDKLTKIFEPFYTTKGVGEGTGLGLSTAYGIVKQSGGYIFVDSTSGVGTSFTLYFPVHAQSVVVHPSPAAPVGDIVMPPVTHVPAAPPEPVASGGSEGVVLLVEDEAPVRAFASRALRMRGYTVFEAENAEQALETLSDENINVDVFVTDVVMPGLDGPSWVRKALETRPDTRVVFVSGYAEEDFADTQARIPNSVFLPKPFSLGELTTTVRDQLV